VGLVLDGGIEEELRIHHLQVADATRASLGLPVLEYIVTDTPLEVSFLTTQQTILLVIDGTYINFCTMLNNTKCSFHSQLIAPFVGCTVNY
jgi:hypothetical protein